MVNNTESEDSVLYDKVIWITQQIKYFIIIHEKYRYYSVYVVHQKSLHKKNLCTVILLYNVSLSHYLKVFCSTLSVHLFSICCSRNNDTDFLTVDSFLRQLPMKHTHYIWVTVTLYGKQWKNTEIIKLTNPVKYLQQEKKIVKYKSQISLATIHTKVTEVSWGWHSKFLHYRKSN